MPTKKKTKKNGNGVGQASAPEIVQLFGDNLIVTIQQGKAKPPRPIRLPGETEEEQAKRLAKRRAMTIKAFQIAHEDHQQRKAAR